MLCLTMQADHLSIMFAAAPRKIVMQCGTSCLLEGVAIRVFDGGKDVIVDIDGGHLPCSVRRWGALMLDHPLLLHVGVKLMQG